MTAFNSQVDALTDTATNGRPYVSFRKRIVTDLTAHARRWVLRDIVPAEPSILAAGQGTGKSHAIFTMALQVAFPEREIISGLQGTRPRQVLIFMESIEAQVPYFIRGLAEYHEIPIKEIEERFTFIPSNRDRSEEWKEHLADIWTAEEFQVAGTPPWVIIDTLSSNIDTTNENDNSEAASIVDALTRKRAKSHGGSELPILIVTHTAKGATSTRGASAFEANIHHVMHLKVTDAQRLRGIWLEKNRAGESQRFAMHTAKGDVISIRVPNDYGDLDERGSIIMEDEGVFVVKAATDAHAREHGWLDKSSVESSDAAHIKKLEVFTELLSKGFVGSKNNLSASLSEAWEAEGITGGIGQTTAKKFISDNGHIVAQTGDQWELVSEADTHSPPAL
ncbi:MAG: AAA family ATPase [Pseudomonadota bacterium]|nr:AAA family ATPase [Pseudomonadota bacterium]